MNLPIIYQTQTGNAISNDCGPAEALGVIQSYNLDKEKTVAQVYTEMLPSGETRGATLDEIISWSNKNGLTLTRQVISTPEALLSILRQKKPVIVLGNYAVLVSKGYTQYTNFTGGHYMTAIGIDPYNVYAHDPDHSDGKGTGQAFLIDDFFQFWLGDISKDVPSYVGLVPNLPIQDLSVVVPQPTLYKITAKNGVNVRSAPVETSSTLTGYIIPFGAIVQIVKRNTKGYDKLVTPYPGNYIWDDYVALA
jgi:hypothetical protein